MLHGMRGPALVGVVLLAGALVVGGCSRSEPVRLRVIYSADLRSSLEPCT